MDRGILYHLGVSRLTGWVRQRLAGRADSEHEQATLRLVLGFVASAYVLSPALNDIPDRWELVLPWTAVAFMAASLALFAAILIWPKVSPLRRVLGLVLDLGTTSFVIGVAGEAGTPLMALYLWVTTGNGFRYGLKYLAASALLSILGFALAYWMSEFWHSHPVFALSIVIALVVIPTYMAALLNKLNRAMVEVQDANQAKRQFLANMSHELRTPLNGVIGMVDLLIDTKLSREQRELAGTIQTSANTLFEIIENILDFSKIEAGRLTLEKTVFDLHGFLADTTQIFAHQCFKKGLSFDAHVDPRLPYLLEGDPHRTRQVLINLISNAIKFTEQGSVQVRALALPERAGDPQVWLRIEIQDTGVGIPPAEQARIFEAFRQGDPSTTRRFGGTGLGTTIASQLTRLMGGRIGFSSQPDQGTLFWIELPFGRPLAPTLAPDLSARHVQVLVLAAATTYRDLQGHCQEWGLACERTESLEATRSALRRAQQTRNGLSVVLIECCHLGRDPLALAAAVRSWGSLERTSLVLLAEPAEAQREGAFLAAGFSCVLYTPIAKPLLYNAVHAAQAAHRLPDNVVSLAEHYREQVGAPGVLQILVAEDNEANQQVIRRILERIGHRVVVVGNGEEALDRLARPEAAFDLLILDMNMPQRGGLEVFKAARFLDPNRPIPTLILTAEATQEAAAACQEAGVEAFLTKPVQAKALLETLARLTRGRAPAEPAVRTKRTTSPSTGQPQPQADKDKPLVDREKLEEILSLSGDAQFFAGLVAGFSRDVARALDRLGSALATRDYPLMREALHALQGSAAELGALRLTELCMEMRRLKPFELGSPQAATLLGQLRDVFEQTQRALAELSIRQHDAFH